MPNTFFLDEATLQKQKSMDELAQEYEVFFKGELEAQKKLEDKLEEEMI